MYLNIFDVLCEMKYLGKMVSLHEMNFFVKWFIIWEGDFMRFDEMMIKEGIAKRIS